MNDNGKIGEESHLSNKELNYRVQRHVQQLTEDSDLSVADGLEIQSQSLAIMAMMYGVSLENVIENITKNYNGIIVDNKGSN